MKARIGSEQPLRSEARKKLRRRLSLLTKIDEMQAEAEMLDEDLRAQVARESARFGVDVPPNALMLDVLELVTVNEDGSWSWAGNTNNKGLPCVRYSDGRHGSERGVTRLLAETFGLIDPDWEGVLYPTNGTQDVNPWHRELRAFPEGKVRGNAGRYGFGL